MVETQTSQPGEFAPTGFPDGLYALDFRHQADEVQASVRKTGMELLGGGPGFTCAGTVIALGEARTLHLEVHQTGAEARPVKNW